MLPQQKKLALAAVTLAMLLAVLALVIHNWASASSPARMAPVATFAPQATTTVAEMPWERVSWPAALADLRWASYAPAPNDSQTVYACGTPAPQDEQPHIVPVVLYVTHDGGGNWAQPQGFSAVMASRCEVQIATNAPNELALLAARALHPTDCNDYDIFLSHDAGVSWHKAPSLPPGPIAAHGQTLYYCSIDIEGTPRHLYVLNHYGVKVTSGNGVVSGPEPELVSRSDDGGASWRRIGSDVFKTSVLPRPLSDGESLAATTTAGSVLTLLISHDAGASWQSQHLAVNGAGSILRLPFGAASLAPTGELPWYLGLEDQIPSHDFFLKVMQITGGSHSYLIPPLPIAGASQDRPGLTTVLGETASGKLLALGLGPQDTVPSVGSGRDDRLYTQQWLWEWDPHTTRWMLFTLPLPQVWPQCSSVCFQGHLSTGTGPNGTGTTLWVSGVGTPLYRALLPDSAM